MDRIEFPIHMQALPEDATLADVINAINAERLHQRTEAGRHLRQAAAFKAEVAARGQVSTWDAHAVPASA